MNRKVLLTVCMAVILQGISAKPVIELNFPLLGESTAYLYYFSGNKVDSLSVKLNGTGKAKIIFPHKNYRGVGYLYIAQAGGVKFLLAEPYLSISCKEKKFSEQTLDFGQSIENSFLYQTFNRRAFLSDKSALDSLNKSIAASPLYAARFLELTSFMQRLYAATQIYDKETQQALQHEMQYDIDISALYTSGNLWNDIHNYYGDLFVSAYGEKNDSAYASSIRIIMMRLKEPVKSAFFLSSIAACERNNHIQAVEIIIKDFVQDYPDLSESGSVSGSSGSVSGNPNMQRFINRYLVSKGCKAPNLVGLSKAINQRALLFFFDSDCGHCRDEADWLVEHYKELISKGYRIISIAADTKENDYASTLPWNEADKLCDFNGFQGANFRNYGVIGTPTIFELDEKGIVKGRYAQAKEMSSEL